MKRMMIRSIIERFFERINIGTELLIPDSSGYIDCKSLDSGLRHKILINDEPDPFLRRNVTKLFQDNSICQLEDRYGCHFLLIPLKEDGGSGILFAGPFLTNNMSIYDIHTMCQQQQIPQELSAFFSQYYSTLTLIRDDSLFDAFLDSIGESCYGNGNYRILSIKETIDKTAAFSRSVHTDRDEETADRLAHRYAIEERLMDAISHGNSEAAVRYVSDPVFSNLDQRVNVPLRNSKNYQIVLNTLCRKAAQRGGVHPIYIDELSRHLSIQIENAESLIISNKLTSEIVRRYCMLVQSRSFPEYSPMIQNVINYINIHYPETSLTLSGIASHFSLNKSYLATLFKKETGTTLTNYVNSCRIEQAIYYINIQSGSIQNIASACGIPDITYFTRLFKRKTGMTPSEYRKMLLKK